MKKIWMLLFLFCAALANAQNTVVSLTAVTDSDGTVWANGSWQIDFNPNPNTPGEGQYRQNGNPLNGSVTHQKGVLSGSGNASFTVYDSSTVFPSGSGWKLTVCPNAKSQCGIYTFSTAGSTQNITAAVNSIIPRPRFVAQIGAYGYNSTEATPLNIPGATYWDVTQGCQNFFNATTLTWSCTASSGGIPAAPGLAVQFANSAASAFQGDTTFNFTPATHELTTAVHNGKASAQGFGTGVNGIAAAVAAFNLFVEANPNYLTVEQYSYETMIPGVPNFFHFLDNRSGMTTNFYHNVTGANFGSVPNSLNENPASYDACLLDGAVTTTIPSLKRTCKATTMMNNQPGWNFGNPPGSAGGWEVSQAGSETHIIRGSGIAQGRDSVQYKFGAGDNVNYYNYIYGQGAWVDFSGEGQKVSGNQVNEYIQRASGTCVTGCTTGSTSIKVTNTTLATKPCTTQVNADCLWGTGQYVIDTTVGGTSTTITNLAAGNGPATAVTISGTVPVSNAVATQSTFCGPAVAADNITTPPFSKSYTCTMSLVSGAFDTTHLLCFSGTTSGNLHECTIPTAVGTPSGGLQNVTMPLRKPHINAGWVYQGGMAGYGLEFTSYNVTPPNGGQLLRYLYDIIGSTSANVIQTEKYKGGIAEQITNNVGISNQLMTGVANLTTLSNSGTTVTFTYNSSGSTIDPRQYQNSSWVISGATDSAFNGTCTSVAWSSTSVATCNLSGLSGTHTAATAQMSLGLNNIVMWPMAEVIDTQNEAQLPPTVDGTLTLEPNIVAWTSTNVVEQPRNASSHYSGMTFNNFYWNPYNLGNGIGVSVARMFGGNTSISSNALAVLTNATPDNLNKGFGGSFDPPNFLNLAGAFQEGFTFDHGPNEAIFRVTTPASQYNNPNYTAHVYVWTGAGTNSIDESYVPQSGKFSLINNNGNSTWSALAHTFFGTMIFNSLVGSGNGCLHADSLGTITRTGTDCGSGGSGMIWPAGGAGIANYNGASGWGTSYSSTNTIPANFIPILNQNTTGTAANLTAAVALPNGTAVTTQTPLDNSTKAASTAYVDAAVAGLTGVTGGSVTITGGTQAANSCTGNSTATDTGLTTSGAFSRPTSSFTTDPSALVGWGSTGGMVFQMWRSSANTVTYHVCNQTGVSITYSSITFSLGAD